MKLHPSHEAMRRSIAGGTSETAKALGVGITLVGKWMLPTEDWSDSGAFNPLDRLETVIKLSLERGKVSRADSLAPITWLAERFNVALIDLPPVGGSLDQQSKALVAAIKEIGEWSAATARSMEDGRITRDEFKEMHREGMEAISQVMACLQIAEREYKEGQGK